MLGQHRAGGTGSLGTCWWWQKGLVGQCSSAPQPPLGLTPLLPLQGYHRSNHFIATQGESTPLFSLSAGFTSWVFSLGYLTFCL